MSKRRKNRGRNEKARPRPPKTPGWGEVVAWLSVALACAGSVWLSKTTFEAPAIDFYRAINRAPWASLDGYAALGVVLTALIGAQAFSTALLGTYAATRLVNGMLPRG